MEEDEGEGDSQDGGTGMESCETASSLPGLRYIRAYMCVFTCLSVLETMTASSHLHHCLTSAGTAAQQLDASFNTSSALEIFEMDFADTSMEMKLRGTLPTSNRSVIIL